MKLILGCAVTVLVIRVARRSTGQREYDSRIQGDARRADRWPQTTHPSTARPTAAAAVAAAK